MQTKFVTSFYAFHSRNTGRPFWGQNARYERYLYSLITLCNMKEKIVCYTDEDDLGYNQLISAKKTYGLENLEIKVYPLIQNPYHTRLYNIRMANPKLYDAYDGEGWAWYSRDPQMYWIKFDFLLNEYEPDINLFWIDAGLATESMFPSSVADYGHEEDYKNWYRNSEPYGAHTHKLYSFKKAFNQQTVEKILKHSGSKVLMISKIGGSNANLALFDEALKEYVPYRGIYPIGGFFGGNSNILYEVVIPEAHRMIEKVLDNGYYLCGDEEILTHIRGKFEQHFNIWEFNSFYHEESEWYVNGNIPFHKFFSEH